MSYLLFQDILKELGHKLNYQAVVNYAGNSFCKDAWDMISKANPMIAGGSDKNVMGGIAGLLSQATVIKPDEGQSARKYSWDEEV